MKNIFSVITLILFLTSFSAAQVNLDSALVASYYFCNNYADSSGNGNDATNAGSAFADDRFGTPNSALSFNGSAYVSLPNAVRFQPLSSASLSFWIKSTQTGRFDLFEQRIGNISPSDLNYNITFNYPSTQHIHYNFPNYNNPPGNYTSQNVLSENAIDGKWHHMVFVKDADANTMSIYQDDSLLGTKIIQDVSFAVNGTLRIGKEISGTYWYTGLVDDIRIYSRVLNTTEISVLYHENTSGLEPFVNHQAMCVYPNPSKDKIFLMNPFSSGSIKSVMIYNYMGQLQSIQADNYREIEISALAEGMYLIQMISTDNLIHTVRFIKN